MEPISNPESTSTGGLSEPVFGRCPLCGHIVEEAFDYDTQGNELFCCEEHDGNLVFAQDKSGAYVIVVDGLPLG